MLRFEMSWQVRRLTFAAITLVLALFALLLVRQGYGPDAANINSPYSVTQSAAFLSLWLLFTQTVFCVHGALRDDEHRMHELIRSRPVSAWQIAGSRLSGIVGSGLLVMTIVLVVQLVSPYVIATDPERVGPFRVMPYVWVLITLMLPNVLLVSALLYAVAMFTRSTIATYVGAIALFALYMVTALTVDSPLFAGTSPPSAEAMARAAVLDPFGFSAFFEAGRYWTPAERNVRLIPLEGRFLTNRLLWLTVTMLVVSATYRWSRRLAVRTRGTFAWRRRSVARVATGDVSAARFPALAYGPVAPSDSWARSFWSALRGSLRTECGLLFGTWTVQALLLLFVASVVIETLSELSSGEYGTRLLATSALMMGRLSESLGVLGSLSVIYFAAEVMWRERQLRFDGVLDATPAASAAFYLGKVGALCAVPLAFTAVGLLTALVVQVTQGNEPVIASVYLGQLWFVTVPMLLRVVMIVALQLVSPNRWIGLIGGLAFTIGTMVSPTPMLEHPMLRYGVFPDAPYSDLDGFGAVPRSFTLLVVYWSGWAMLIAAVSWGLWRRGFDRGVWSRVRTMRATWGRSGTGAALSGLAVIVLVGGPLLYRANRNSPWESDRANAAWRVAYERSYRHVEAYAQPSIVHVAMAVDLAPERRVATVHGTLSLENRAERATDTMWIATRRDVRDASVRIDGARLVRFDARFGMWVFALAEPMMPGSRRQLTYAYAIDRGSLRVDGFAQDVAENGSYLLSTMLLPSLGYRTGYEEDNPRLRREAGLGEPREESAPLTAALTDSLTRVAKRGAGAAWFTLALTVSTAPDQIVVGPGRLTREWTANGRRYFAYRSDQPMTPVFSLASARYAVRRATQDGVTIELWYHPTHDRNVDRMLVAAQRTLQIMGTRFGAYPLPVLRMAEVPSGWRFGGFATTGALYFTEDRGMLTDERTQGIDLVSRRVAHEVAHQWWGHTVDPLNMPGGLLIVESLAKYAEQRVIASLYGEDAVAPILAYDHDRYLSGRARDASAEPTLVELADQSHLDYGKGALAFSALRAALGDSALTVALVALRAEQHGPRGAATAARLHELVRAAAATSLDQRLVDEWLHDRVLYDVALDSATTQRVGDHYRLAAFGRMQRIVQVGAEERTSAAEGQRLDIVVRGGDADTVVLHRGAATVTGGVVTIILDLATLPSEIELDPMVRWIDRDRSNNRRKVMGRLP